jgi:hypothetical protein
MERPQTLPNLWLILKTIGWVIMLDGVLEYFSYRHYNTIFHQLLVVVLGHDPARPRLPDSWEEWYNS